MEIEISHLNHVRQEQRGLRSAVLFPSPLRFRVDPSGTKKGTECVADLNPETLGLNCGARGTRPANRAAKRYGNTPAEWRIAGGSASIVTDERNGVEVYLDLRLNER